MRDKSRWKWGCAGCYVSSLMSPAAWLYFTVNTRNTFRLDEFSGGDLAVCLALSVIPAVLFFLSWWLQGRHVEPVRGGLAACFCFLLAAAGWLFTIAEQWDFWRAAYRSGLPQSQWLYLCIAACVGAAFSLIPLLSKIPEAFHQD